MRISKSRIIYTIFFGAIFCFDWFIMKPHVNEKYLTRDRWNFEFDSWKYTLISVIIVYLFFVSYSLFSSIKSSKKSIFHYIFLLIPTLLFVFVLDFFIERTALYLNTMFDNDILEKEYVLQKYEQNKVFQLYDNKNEIITGKKELDRIDLGRKSKNLKSIYELNNNDTIIVKYQIGFPKTKYFE